MSASACPLTVRPGQILGHRSNGRPIFAMAGASPDGDGAAGSTDTGTGSSTTGSTDTGTATGTGTAATTTAGTAGTTAASSTATQVEKVEDLPAWAQKIIKDARKEAGDNRTAATAADTERQKLLDGIATALGVKKDEPLDPAKLAEQLTSTSTQLVALQRETAAAKAARAQNADVDKLLDSRAFVDKLDKLDPTANTFEASLKTLVEKTLTDNPTFKQTQAAGVSGAAFNAGTGEGKTRSNSLGAAIAAATATT